MAHEIVITSVRRGLDGGSGYQPVLRTRGMKPAVAERLQIRSGYSHPYPFGDPRNPVVFIHRIERVAGETLHVLGRICDAGSDHTGRSNFLAHLAALDDTEARRKTAGPADVARRFAFKTTWNEQPREADSPPVIGGDRSPAACAAWRAAGLDPGLAGDLAEAAANGKEIRLIVREGDDVLALFADAIAMLPPAKRWQVTFNTCEIEPFDATWRAVREDLAQVRSWRGAPDVIDLTSAATKGSDSPYARFARGEASSLPWQAPARELATPSTAIATSAPQVLSSEESSQPASGPVVHDASETHHPPVGPPSFVDTAPPPPDEPAPSTIRKKRNYLEHMDRAAFDRDQRDSATPTRSNVLRFAGLVALFSLLLMLIGALTVISFNPELVARLAGMWPGFDDSGGEQAVLVEPDGPGEESTSLGEAEQAERRRRDDETARNKKREEEAARIAREESLKHKAADEARIKQEQQQKQAAEQAATQQARDDKLRKQKSAYEKIANHEAITLEDLPVAGGIGGGPQKQSVICRLDADNLVDLSFDVAVPTNPLSEGEPFEATIRPSAEERLSWQISATPTRTIDKDSNASPIPLAMISVIEGQLVLKPARSEILGNQLFSHLRQSVLLVKARNPERPNNAADVVKAIQLVRPVVKSPFEINLLASSTKIELNPPRGVFANTTAGKQEGFPENAVVEYEVAYDFALNGGAAPEVYPRKASSTDKPAFVPLLQCPPMPRVPQNPPTVLGLLVTFGAGLSPLKITTEIKGPAQHAFDLVEIGRKIRETDDDFQKRLDQLEQVLANKYKPLCGLVDNVNVDRWFAVIKLYERDLKAHFQPEPLAGWVENCRQILVQASQVQRPAKSLAVPGRGIVEVTPAEFNRNIIPFRTQWENVFVSRIETWAADYNTRQREHSTQIRQYFKPLLTPARVTVRAITIETKAPDEKPYTVTLLRGDPSVKPQRNSEAEPPATAQPQL